MPVDKEGNIADIIYDGDSIIKRMNIGVLYEQYINATSRDLTKQIRKMMDVKNAENYKASWDLLLKYYSIVSPKMYNLITSKEYKGTIESHVNSILDDGIYVWIPTDNPKDTRELIKQLNEQFYVCFDKVTYDGGKVTEREVLIGSTYLLLLEKTGSDWAAVSSAKLQHFGVPAKITKADKFSSPGRNQPVRIMGESEVRLLNSVVGSDYVVDILDQSNSPTTHKYIVNNILNSDKPLAIKEIVDRREIPLGNSRSLQFANHVMEAGGVKFVRKLDDPIRIQDVENRLKK